MGRPEVGRRFMVAFMRGSRDYKRAVESGERRDEVVQILVKHTAVKDPAMYARMGSGWVDSDLAMIGSTNRYVGFVQITNFSHQETRVNFTATADGIAFGRQQLNLPLRDGFSATPA